MSPPRILDGRALAEARLPALAARARRVAARRGHPPRLLLLAFRSRDGQVPHLQGKVRACTGAGLEVHPVLLDADADTGSAVAALEAGLEAHDPDGVFVQFPLAEGVAAAALAERIPVRADVDAMCPAPEDTGTELPAPENADAMHSVRQDAGTPLTALATLALLESGGVELAGRAGVLIADPDPYHALFREALVRRGVRMSPLVSPHDPQVESALRGAELVVVSVARPGAVPARWLAPGSVVVDAGYFNGGGRGDVDLSGGATHLAALAPVPGGVGPMTVSALIEAVVARAELRT